MDGKLNPSEIRTLMTVYNISDTKPVGPARVARERGITRVSALETLRSLANKGMGRYVDHRGLVLNEKGRKTARFYIWKHRTVETYLYREFSLCKNKACEKARDIDLTIDDAIAYMMYVKMGEPECCPCGHEIPREVMNYEEMGL